MVGNAGGGAGPRRLYSVGLAVEDGGKGIGEGTRAFHFFQNFEICQATGLFSSFSSSLEQGLEFGRVQSLCLAPTIPLGTL